MSKYPHSAGQRAARRSLVPYRPVMTKFQRWTLGVLLVALPGCAAATPTGGQSTATIQRPAGSGGAVTVTPVPTARQPITMLTPAAAPDPTSVAADLQTAESGIRSPATRIIFMSYLARLQQDAYRQLVAHSDWVPAVLAQVTPDIRQVIQANLTADLEIRALNGNAHGLPHWRIVDPPPADQLLNYYREAQRQFGVQWEYLAAIHLIETRMSRVQGTSVAGAQGPMQFMPATWAAYGRGSINDPHDAILAAARYLHANGAPSDMGNAIYHYNPSWRYVRAVMLYAQQMIVSERAFIGYYYWQVYVSTGNGDVLLPTGYSG